MRSPTRRSLLSCAVLAAASGCLDGTGDGAPTSGDSEDDGGNGSAPDDVEADDEDGSAGEPDGATSDETESCNLPRRYARGEGPAIETTAQLGEDEDPAERCARAAGEAAYAHLREQLSLDLAEDGQPWLFPGYRDRGEPRAQVSVRAVIDSREGGVITCPDPAFDVDEAVAAVPSEVTVSLEQADSEPHECTEPVWLESRTLYED